MPTDFILAPLSISLSTCIFSKQAKPYKLSLRKYLKHKKNVLNDNLLARL